MKPCVDKWEFASLKGPGTFSFASERQRAAWCDADKSVAETESRIHIQHSEVKHISDPLSLL